MNKLLVSGLAGALLISTIFWVTLPSKTVKTVEVKDVSSEALGALTGPDIPYQYISVGGVQMYSTNIGFTKDTTTPRAIQSPAATSTLTLFAAKFDVSTTSATTVRFTRGTAPQATTTALSGQLALAANARGSFVASSTPEATFIVPPSNWVQVSLVGGSGTVSPVGTCVAQFTVL